jgi:uncharacterized membrane protein HdeD (DUF308 family)
MRGMTQNFIPTLAMIGVLALICGGLHLIRKGLDPKRGWLMIVAAVVLFANILILTWPAQATI